MRSLGFAEAARHGRSRRSRADRRDRGRCGERRPAALATAGARRAPGPARGGGLATQDRGVCLVTRPSGRENVAQARRAGGRGPAADGSSATPALDAALSAIVLEQRALRRGPARGRRHRPRPVGGPVVVPFGGALARLGGTRARSMDSPDHRMRRCGSWAPRGAPLGADATRAGLLADASLDRAADGRDRGRASCSPRPGREGVRALADEGADALLVVGLSERWRRGGPRAGRGSALEDAPPAPTVFVRGGARPGRAGAGGGADPLRLVA